MKPGAVTVSAFAPGDAPVPRTVRSRTIAGRIGSVVAVSIVASVALTAPRARADERPIRVLHHQTGPETLLYWQELRAGRPGLRGFRAPLFEWASLRSPADPWPDAPPDVRDATAFVARRLAADGLIATLAGVIRRLGPAGFVEPLQEDRVRSRLMEVGLPADWVRHFRPPGDAPGDLAVVPHVARLVRSATAAEERPAGLDAVRFFFSPSRPGFRVATESGEYDFDLLRLQMTRGDYFAGEGAGDSLDIARQLAAALPDVPLLFSVEWTYLDGVRRVAGEWRLTTPGRLTMIAEPLVLSQWAQDNGKPGFLDRAADAARRALLVPRYASRRDDGSEFFPGESFLADGLAAAGISVIQSPLLFQGGNVMAVRDPADGTTTLLLGEAEVHRNVSLGLRREEALEAFRIEFGVDRCVVLPAVSFHIDFELSVRAVDGRLTAFVNDPDAAVPIILRAGVEALARAGQLSPEALGQARASLAANQMSVFLEQVGGLLQSRAVGRGQYPESLARAFSVGAADSGVGNLHRFLLAMDVVAFALLSENALPSERHARAYVHAFRRRTADRENLHRQITSLGWRVIGVPSLAETGRGLNYINGLHDRTRYLLPAYGGLYRPLDEAAAKKIQMALSENVTVIPILCGESQRRDGGVHCSVSAFYRTNPR